MSASRKPKSNRRVDYYTVNIPLDCETNPEKRAELAFMEIENRSRVYHLPCTWRVVWDNPNTGLMRVCKTWYAPEKIVIPAA